MNLHTMKNKLRAFLQTRCPFLWKFRDAHNDKAMLERYEKRKALPPEAYRENLETLFQRTMGFPLDLDNPVRYTEKIQWRKLYDKDPRLQLCTDKVLVRDWVREKIGEQYLIPALGVYDSFDEIDFDALPDSFVLKTNHSSGWNIVVKDKAKFDKAAAKKKFDMWLSMDYSFVTGFELHYSGIKPKILCEKYMEDSAGELKDYKFLCFNSQVKYCWVDVGRSTNHLRNVYDMDWQLQPWRQCYDNTDKPIGIPENFQRMKDLAKILCQDFGHVRVDLYNVDGRIYFGEMTFTNGSGFEKILPDEYDAILGQEWKIQ